MKRLRVFCEFYKVNLVVFLIWSILIGCVFGPVIYMNSIIIIAIISEITSFLFYKFYRKHELYFYYNFRFSLRKLYFFSLGLTLSISFLILYLYEGFIPGSR